MDEAKLEEKTPEKNMQTLKIKAFQKIQIKNNFASSWSLLHPNEWNEIS